MRCAAMTWYFVGVLAVLAVGRLSADESPGQTLRTDHYDLYCEGDLDVAELGRLLDSLHATLTRYFGDSPKERLRIEILANEDRFKERLAKAGQLYQGGGGVYGPTFKTAWLFIQPSLYYTRHLLLHEATHQFHFLVACGNQFPSAEWYTEGLADYMGLHTWDGERLTVGDVPLVSLEDYPAQALKQFDQAQWDMAAIVAGAGKVDRHAGWMLAHFLINRDFEAFRQLAARLDRREEAGEAYTKAFGEITDDTIRDLKQWVTQRQQPFADVWIRWQPWGDRIEGHGDVVSLCVAKKTPACFQAEMKHVDGHLKAGVVFGFQSPKNFCMMQLWGDRKAHILRRDADRWRDVGVFSVPPPEGNDWFQVEQLADDQVSLAVNGKVMQRMKAPGQVGLTVDACRARFRVKDVRPGPYKDLLTLMGKQGATDLADAGSGDTLAESADTVGTPTQAAAGHGERATVATGPSPAPFDPNRRDADGRTPLHVAALEGDVAAIERLLAAGADVERTLDNGVTPLMMAAFKGERQIANLLLKAGADVLRATPRGTTALHYAAAGGDLPLVRSLLAAGAKVDAKKPGGTTPLILAAQNGQAEVIAALIEAGADVHARLLDQRITGLMLAAQNGHTQAVRALLHAGADWRAKDGKGHRAIEFARANERTAIVGILEKVIAEAESRADPPRDD